MGQPCQDADDLLIARTSQIIRPLNERQEASSQHGINKVAVHEHAPKEEHNNDNNQCF